MTTRKSTKSKTPVRRRKQADDAPLTAAELKRARPAREVMPELVPAYRDGTLRARGRLIGSNKMPVSLRLDKDVVTFFKAKGPGWQTRIDKALKAFVELTR